jgi:hypothetical protein
MRCMYNKHVKVKRMKEHTEEMDKYENMVNEDN